MTVAAYAQRWLKSVRLRRKVRTGETYADVVRDQIARSRLGRTSLDELTRAKVRDFLDDQLRRYASTTVRLHLAVLHACLNAARFEDELIVSNPADRLGRLIPAYRRVKRRALNREELERFLAAAATASPSLHGLFLVAVRTGLRVGELLAVRWEDLDLDRRVMRVERGLDWRNREATPKGNRSRVVGLSPKATAHLQALRVEHIRANGKGARWVFHNPAGRPWSRTFIWRKMRRICLLAGLSPRSAHALRVTFATCLAERGIPTPTIRDLLGHRSVVVTEGYLELTGGSVAAVDRLDD